VHSDFNIIIILHIKCFFGRRNLDAFQFLMHGISKIGVGKISNSVEEWPQKNIQTNN
jgi:hypothetical protein